LSIGSASRHRCCNHEKLWHIDKVMAAKSRRGHQHKVVVAIIIIIVIIIIIIPRSENFANLCVRHSPTLPAALLLRIEGRGGGVLN